MRWDGFIQASFRRKSMVFPVSVVRGHVPDPHIMEKQAFVSVSIVTVSGACKATGLPFVWVFRKIWSSHDC